MTLNSSCDLLKGQEEGGEATGIYSFVYRYGSFRWWPLIKTQAPCSSLAALEGPTSSGQRTAYLVPNHVIKNHSQFIGLMFRGSDLNVTSNKVVTEINPGWSKAITWRTHLGSGCCLCVCSHRSLNGFWWHGTLLPTLLELSFLSSWLYQALPPSQSILALTCCWLSMLVLKCKAGYSFLQRSLWHTKRYGESAPPPEAATFPPSVSHSLCGAFWSYRGWLSGSCCH